MLNVAAAFTPAGLAVLGQVIVIDLTLASDNVVVLGTLAAGLPAAARRKVLAIGVGIALVCRIALALVATQLLHIVGLLFVGGVLLLWVAWRLFRKLRSVGEQSAGRSRASSSPPDARRAVVGIALADLSMSLDNVLAVAGTARHHPPVLIFGLILSVTLMGLAADLVSRLIERFRWIAYAGLAAILWVAARMMYDGITDQEVGLALLLR